MDIIAPKGWRKGQTLFNFLEWLSQEKGYEQNQSTRMADPFNIPNAKLDQLYDEYIMSHLTPNPQP